MRILKPALIILLSVGCAKTPDSKFAKVLLGHESAVLCLDNDRGGRYLCSGSYDNSVILWDYDSGKLIKRYSGSTGGIWSVRLSPDSKYLAWGSWDNNINARGSNVNCVSLLDLSTLKIIRSFTIEPARYKTHAFIPELDDSTSNGINKISFNPESTRLAVVTNRGDLFIWDLDDDYKKSEFLFGDTEHKLIDISPDWSYLVCTENRRRMVDSCFYFMTTGQNVIARFDTPSKTFIDVFFSNDQRIIATIGGNRITRNEIYLWDTGNRKLLHTLTGHRNVIRSMDFSSDDRFLVSASEDNLVNLWNVVSGELIATFTEDNNKELTSVLFSNDDRYLITGSQDKSVKYLDIHSLTAKK